MNEEDFKKFLIDLPVIYRLAKGQFDKEKEIMFSRIESTFGALSSSKKYLTHLYSNNNQTNLIQDIVDDDIDNPNCPNCPKPKEEELTEEEKQVLDYQQNNPDKRLLKKLEKKRKKKNKKNKKAPKVVPKPHLTGKSPMDFAQPSVDAIDQFSKEHTEPTIKRTRINS
jgi:hypothetical protein